MECRLYDSEVAGLGPFIEHSVGEQVGKLGIRMQFGKHLIKREIRNENFLHANLESLKS